MKYKQLYKEQLAENDELRKMLNEISQERNELKEENKKLSRENLELGWKIDAFKDEVNRLMTEAVILRKIKSIITGEKCFTLDLSIMRMDLKLDKKNETK